MTEGRGFVVTVFILSFSLPSSLVSLSLPPFFLSLYLPPSAPPPPPAEADSGRGGAELYTLGALDREEHRQLAVGVVVRDAGGMSATQVVSVVIDDVNDNRMRPAAKTVYLWKTQVSVVGMAEAD